MVPYGRLEIAPDPTGDAGLALNNGTALDPLCITSDKLSDILDLTGKTVTFADNSSGSQYNIAATLQRVYSSDHSFTEGDGATGISIFANRGDGTGLLKYMDIGGRWYGNGHGSHMAFVVKALQFPRSPET